MQIMNIDQFLFVMLCMTFSKSLLKVSADNFQKLLINATVKNYYNRQLLLNNSMVVTVSDCTIAQKAKQLAPPLTNDKHKGQAGRIGVFGGSLEFTGAPYFSAIGSLKVGADLVYVFTIKDAATVIKSYSPELMVLPFLDDAEALTKIEPWLDRLHVALIGPGLGRANHTGVVFEKIIDVLREKKIPLVIDADGLFFVAQNPAIIKDYPSPVILTPNLVEFNRVIGNNNGDGTKLQQAKSFLEYVGDNVTIICKDRNDDIIGQGKIVTVSGGGSGRRCGGQGDLLGGALSTFFSWALQQHEDIRVACYAACKLTRDCNSKAFAKYGRSMTVTDMIKEVHEVFEENFELNTT